MTSFTQTGRKLPLNPTKAIFSAKQSKYIRSASGLEKNREASVCGYTHMAGRMQVVKSTNVHANFANNALSRY